MKIQYLVYGFWCNVYIRVGELYKFQSSAIYRLFTHTVQDTTPIRKRIYTRLYSYTGDFSYLFIKKFGFVCAEETERGIILCFWRGRICLLRYRISLSQVLKCSTSNPESQNAGN
jgi:hypothetical protein